MRTISSRALLSCLFLAAAALAGCNRFNPVRESREQQALIAGGNALSTISRCVLHMEQARGTAIPECDAEKQVAAYDVAKGAIPAPYSPALQALDEKIQNAKADAIGAMVAIAWQSAAATPPRPGASAAQGAR